MAVSEELTLAQDVYCLTSSATINLFSHAVTDEACSQCPAFLAIAAIQMRSLAQTLPLVCPESSKELALVYLGRIYNLGGPS